MTLVTCHTRDCNVYTDLRAHVASACMHACVHLCIRVRAHERGHVERHTRHHRTRPARHTSRPPLVQISRAHMHTRVGGLKPKTEVEVAEVPLLRLAPAILCLICHVISTSCVTSSSDSHVASSLVSAAAATPARAPRKRVASRKEENACRQENAWHVQRENAMPARTTGVITGAVARGSPRQRQMNDEGRRMH